MSRRLVEMLQATLDRTTPPPGAAVFLRQLSWPSDRGPRPPQPQIQNSPENLG